MDLQHVLLISMPQQPAKNQSRQQQTCSHTATSRQQIATININILKKKNNSKQKQQKTIGLLPTLKLCQWISHHGNNDLSDEPVPQNMMCATIVYYVIHFNFGSMVSFSKEIERRDTTLHPKHFITFRMLTEERAILCL